MSVMTVLGSVEAGELGITLPHEHLFIDLTCEFTEPPGEAGRELAYQPVGPENYAVLARNPYVVRDNLLLDDLDTAVEELAYFQRLGGRTVVDCTSVGAGRDPGRLREVAQRTGLNVVAGSGYYMHETHPPEMAEWTPEQIAEEIVRDLSEGIGDSGVRAGVIGEIGTGDPIHPGEIKSLRAAALAHEATGAPLQIHTYPWGQTGLEILDLLDGYAVDPARVVICHTDVAPDLGYMRRLLERGALVEFDDFGKEFPVDPAESDFAGGPFATDPERVEALARLVEWGYERQLLVTNDICLKQMLHRYGGRGYDHILAEVVPLLRETGLTQESIDRLLVENPARWLEGPT
jgi:phosphotriesterase-related protein